MRALKVDSPGHASVHNDVPIPRLRPDYILVKTSAVALNPTDWKHIKFVTEPTTLGCDYSGTVVEVGSAVTKAFKKGDRVAGVVHGGNELQPEDGAFGEYLVAKGDLQCRIPDSLSFEDASTLGVGVSTVGQGMYQDMELPWPDGKNKKRFPVLIYGASTATGALAVQFAKLSGLEVIATSAPRNFDMIKELGADVVFDHYDPDCGKRINKYTKNKLFYAFDCYSEGQSPKVCCDALSSTTAPDGKKPRWNTILTAKPTRDGVDVGFTLAYTIWGEDVVFRGTKIPTKPEDFEFAKKFWDTTEKLLAEGKIKTHRAEVRPGGLDGILSGLDDLEHQRVSGKKLVYRIGEN